MPKFYVSLPLKRGRRPVGGFNRRQIIAIALITSRAAKREAKIEVFGSVREAERRFGGKLGGTKLAVARGDKRAERHAGDSR